MTSIKVYDKQGGSFLDPGNVGSHVQWYVNSHVEKRKDGSVSSVSCGGAINLGDCNRVISWGLHSSAHRAEAEPDEEDSGMDDLTKLDNAIAELTKCRKAFAKALLLMKGNRKRITEKA